MKAECKEQINMIHVHLPIWAMYRGLSSTNKVDEMNGNGQKPMDRNRQHHTIQTVKHSSKLQEHCHEAT